MSRRSSSIQKYEPFEIRVDTKINAGDSGLDNFTIKPYGFGNYRYYVDWGDGSISASTANSHITHSYDPAGTGVYDIKIYGRFDAPYWYKLGASDATKIRSILSWGNVKFRDVFTYAFRGATNLTGVTTSPLIDEAMDPNTHNFNGTWHSCTSMDGDFGNYTLNTNNLSGFFFNCQSFNNGGSPSISGWSVSHITQGFANMFNNCSSFNQPIGSWDVSGVSGTGTFQNMFWAATSFDQDLGDWDFSNLSLYSGLNYMFYGCDSFNNGGSPSISGWTFPNVTELKGLFDGANSFNQDIGNWDVGNISDMTSLFDQTTVFNNGGSPSISGWTTSACTNMSTMFLGSAFNQPISSWDVSNVIYFSSMFGSTTAFNQPIGSWDVSNAQYMGSMFNGSDVFDQDIGNWDVSNVLDMSNMFRFSPFNNGGSPSISGWTTSACTNMSFMFNGSNCLFNQPIDSWDVSNVTSMYGMFGSGNNTFNQPLGSWDVTSVTAANGFRNMFQNTVFNQDIGNWDVSNAVGADTFRGMFYQAYQFNNGGSPSISGWTFNSAITSLREMFFDCNSFNQPIGSWDVSNIQIFYRMFYSINESVIPNLPDITTWDVSSATDMYQMFTGGFSTFPNRNPFNQDIGGWNVSGVTNMSGMLDNTLLSTTNYNSILTGWTGWNGVTATKTLQPNVNFGCSLCTYTSGSTAEDARNYLITGLTWTITDAGGV